MDYIHITRENIDKEHICCAMSGKQSLAKKEWMKQRFEEGLVFYRSQERGRTPGCLLRQRGGSIFIVCGFPAP